MNLDVSTIILLTAVSAFVMSIAMVITSANYPHIKGIGKWAWACLIQGVGWYLIFMRGSVHDFFSIVLANTLIVASAILLYQAISDFREKESRYKVLYAMLFVFFLVFIYLTFVDPSFVVRSIITSAVGSIMMFLCAYQLLGTPTGKPMMSERVMAIGFLTVGIAAFTRIFDMALDTHETELFVQNGFHSLVFGLIFISIMVLTFSFALMINDKFMAEILRLATLDSLTEVYNRAAMERLIHKEIERSKRYNLLMSLLLVDLDHFKRVNDNFGHQVGDFVLKTLVESISKELRDHDIIGRFGGEEFLILLPDTDFDNSKIVAERIRKIVEKTRIEVKRKTIKVTISIGLATLINEEDNFREIFRRADMGLYSAKQAGRNRVFAIREDRVPVAVEQDGSTPNPPSNPQIEISVEPTPDLLDL